MALIAGQGEGGLLKLVRMGVNTGAVAQEDLEERKGDVKGRLIHVVFYPFKSFSMQLAFAEPT